MYIIGNKLNDDASYENIGNTEFIKRLVNNFTKGLIKNTDESCNSHLYCELSNPDNSALICCRF